MYSDMDVQTLPWTGFPIRKSPGQSLFGGSPELIAACHVLHRLLTPRHPPPALSSLATNFCIPLFKNKFERFHLHTSNVKEQSRVNPVLSPKAQS